MDEINAVKIGSGELGIFWLGQNSFIIKTSTGGLIAIDPYFSRTPRFKYIHEKPPICSEDLRVDFVFCTHDHLDHTDPDTLSKVVQHSAKTVFLGPKESCDRFLNIGISPQRIKKLEANETIALKEFKVTPLYSIPPTVPVNTTHFGYIFDFGFVKAYNMGDSNKSMVDDPTTVLGAVAEHAPEIAMFPIIGDFRGRTPRDAYEFSKILRPKIVIPCHYGCFTNRTIDPHIYANLFDDTSDIQVVIIDYKGHYIYKSNV
ncbi:MAG: MBL fold metallo-hydrolase [Candidatus Bathyarchaeota archaeon]|nr:MBL fold metallo-hydrolase [Candidatus Bathyarchaeota archaeon]